MKVSKAVFPVAGLGTRTLPATKVIAKEMLPVVDKPIMQYAVEEAIAAGITELIFVTSPAKKSIEAHFINNEELEQNLLSRGKQDLYELIHDIIPKNVSIASVDQLQQLGLGHAILCARELAGNEPVAVLLPDDLIYTEGDGCLQQMVEMYNRTQCSIIATEEVPRRDTSKYGIVEKQQDETGFQKIISIVEKPAPDVAPSTSAVVGRYILTPQIWQMLDQTRAGAGNEIQLTDAIAALLAHEHVYLCEFAGVRYDCGSKLGYMQANVAYALRDPVIAGEFSEFLANNSG